LIRHSVGEGKRGLPTALAGHLSYPSEHIEAAPHKIRVVSDMFIGAHIIAIVERD